VDLEDIMDDIYSMKFGRGKKKEKSVVSKKRDAPDPAALSDSLMRLGTTTATGSELQ
jgi:hypothetical protein